MFQLIGVSHQKNMHPLNQALAVFVVALFFYTAIIQSARRKLSPEHLFELEKLQGFSWRSSLPVIPFFICLTTVKLIPHYREAQFAAALVLSVVLAVFEALRGKRQIEMAGLPASFVASQFWAICILEVGVVLSVAVVLPHVSWR